MPPLRRPAAVVFDLDGTLVETETLATETGLATARDRGAPLTRDFFDALSGVDDASREARIAAVLGGAEPGAEFMADWYGRFGAALSGPLPLMPGVGELFDRLDALGLPFALATSSTRPHAERKLASAGIAGRFAAVITVEDVARPKPAPDPYLLAAERLNLPAGDCLAFEDSGPGVASARAAGMPVIWVPSEGGPAAEGADGTAPTLLEGAALAGL